MFDKVANGSNISFGFRFLVLPRVDLLGSNFLNERIQCHEIDIFEVVVTSACLF